MDSGDGNEAERIDFALHAYDYAGNYFFLDSAYKTIWREAKAHPLSVIPEAASHSRIKQIEVWESMTGIGEVSGVQEALALAELPLIPSGARYSDAIRGQPRKQGSVEAHRFRRLPTGSFTLDRNLGVLCLLNLRSDRSYAVSYRVEAGTTAAQDDLRCGSFASGSGGNDTLVLKLIYRPDFNPAFSILWQRQLRNIFVLADRSFNPSDVNINVYYRNDRGEETEFLGSRPDKLLNITGLDRVDNFSGASGPDGLPDSHLDLFNGIRGELIFPELEPFGEGLRSYLIQNGGEELAERIMFSSAYTREPWRAAQDLTHDRFLIRGSCLK